MKSSVNFILLLPVVTFMLLGCDGDDYTAIQDDDTGNPTLAQVIQAEFGEAIDFDNLENYAQQPVPNYITKDNSGRNAITDKKATLGRILFYDRNLSTDNSVSCASCHQQAFAFSDRDLVSAGVNGMTARHSMRLVNARFAEESAFFWDERALTLEQQTTQPIQDHAEMGFSGQEDAPDLQDLLLKLAGTEYYPMIFEHIYGDDDITEERLQECLAQFIRSIQSFDSKFDEGLAQTGNLNQDFPNYTDQENQGKRLFLGPTFAGGAGCISCHRAPEFDIDPNGSNNGVIGTFGDPTLFDLEVTRSPSLRDVVNINGVPNGPFMHDASLASIDAVIRHYNSISRQNNPSLDPRLIDRFGQNGQQLNLTDTEIAALVSFLGTLTGQNLYTDVKWSDPFPE